ncbi:hypothetical protein ACJ72_00715, partial [Emergomyces africanus]
LNTGQLVKDEHFTLFEAVGALEIMDEKMDSGYLAPGETLDDDYDVVKRRLLPEEVVGIMDQLLGHEVCVYYLPDRIITACLDMNYGGGKG